MFESVNFAQAKHCGGNMAMKSKMGEKFSNLIIGNAGNRRRAIQDYGIYLFLRAKDRLENAKSKKKKMRVKEELDEYAQNLVFDVEMHGGKCENGLKMQQVREIARLVIENEEISKLGINEGKPSTFLEKIIAQINTRVTWFTAYAEISKAMKKPAREIEIFIRKEILKIKDE